MTRSGGRSSPVPESERREVVELAIELGSARQAWMKTGYAVSTIVKWGTEFGVDVRGRSGRPRQRHVLDLARHLGPAERALIEQHAESVDAEPGEVVRWAVLEYFEMEAS